MDSTRNEAMKLVKKRTENSDAEFLAEPLDPSAFEMALSRTRILAVK